MSPKKIGLPSIASALVAIALSVASSWYVYKTGCTADLKTGSIGDVQLALHYSEIGFDLFLAGIFCGAFAVGFNRNVAKMNRISTAILVFIASGVFLWLLNMQLETNAIQTCLAH